MKENTTLRGIFIEFHTLFPVLKEHGAISRPNLIRSDFGQRTPQDR